MSARNRPAEIALKLFILCGLSGSTGTAIADEAETPDMEFLEYLGSWEATDEDWVLFIEEDIQETAPGDEESDPAPQEEKVAELDDED